MPDLKGLENIQLVISFIVPGLIIVYIRARFINGRIERISDNIVAYLSVTTVYYGLMLPFQYYLVDLSAGFQRALFWWILVALCPAVFGLLLGVGSQQGWLRWLAHKIGLRPIHTVPVAWDWKFGSCRGACFIMVTLASGETVSGIFGMNSFASSDPSERDIYIEELYDAPDDDGEWRPRPNRQGMLIPAKEIRHVQFWS